MRRANISGVTILALCLAVASTAMAQQEGRQRGGFGGGGFGGAFGRGPGGFRPGATMLLANADVQQELALSSEQKSQLEALRDEARGEFGGGFGGRGGGNFRDMTEEEREKFRADMQKRLEEGRQRMEEQNKKAEAILSADQNKRLKEIALWARGNVALNDEEVAKELNLSDEQKDQVKTIADESGKQITALFGGGERGQAGERGRRGERGRGGRGGERGGENREKIAQIRSDADEEYIAVLTPEQKAKFDQMKGAKPAFDTDDLFRFGGFGGRGGPGERRDGEGRGRGGEGRGPRRGGNSA